MGVVAKPASSQSNEGEWFIKGAAEEVISRCDTYIASRSTIVLDEKVRARILGAAHSMAEEGLRVLAFASGKGEGNGDKDRDARGLTFAGLVGMSDPPRPGVASAIRKLLKGGVRVMMITGDSSTTALSIAKVLEIPLPSPVNSAILTGHDIDSMTDSELADAISQVAIFARTTPRHKLKIISALQQRGDVVAMTGDGVNDAPALKMADIGVAMGLGGTDVAQEAADMILSDDDFSTILSAIEEGMLQKYGYANRRQRNLFEYPKFLNISVVNVGGRLVFDCSVDVTRSPESSQRDVNPVDQHTHERSISTISRRRSRRSGGHEQTPS